MSTEESKHNYQDWSCGDSFRRKEHRFQHRGPKTFRRGRALAFLEMMNLKRSTLKQQLNSPEFTSIQDVLIGELKAIEMVINEFIQLFELHEFEAIETDSKETEEEK